MTMLTTEEKENSHCVRKIMAICAEAIDQNDKSILERSQNFLASDIVLRPLLASAKNGVTTWEMEGVEQIIQRFGRLFYRFAINNLVGLQTTSEF